MLAIPQIDHFDFLVSYPPHQILATPLRTGLPGLRKRDTRFVVDMVVADVVCGRCRRFPNNEYD